MLAIQFRPPGALEPRAWLLLYALSGALALTAAPASNSIPVRSDWPDPLTTIDGFKIDNAQQWNRKRRPELQRLFETFMYGKLPAEPRQMETRIEGDYDDFLDGKATLRLVKLLTGPDKAPVIDLMLVIPNQRSGPPPVFLALNFCGNQALTADTRVPLTRGWVGTSCAGCTNNHATEAARGTQATNWPLAAIIERGYALATFHNGDVDSDRPDVSEGIYAWLANGKASANNPTNRGTIAAWAWGFHRCVDYLVTESDIDPQRIAVVGHSRNGKTALLAAAFDERIAMVFPHQAGCGGTAPSRGTNGESVKAINDRFPHWFNAEFKRFNNVPEKLPIDQHCLVALCAPRPVLFSAAQEDQWSNPPGQFEVLRAADKVYRLLGTDGLAAKQMPPLHQLVKSHLGYYIREGKHSMTAGDWEIFMQFADHHWKRKPAG